MNKDERKKSDEERGITPEDRAERDRMLAEGPKASSDSDGESKKK